MNILMVCLGNICRSPLAEGILQAKINHLKLPWTVDSAGTGSWHIGDPPDPRSVLVADKHGIDITGQRARQFSVNDFENFDWILAMDFQNKKDIIFKARTPAQSKKVQLIMEFLPQASFKDVPDPYWDDDGFEKVFQMLDLAIGAMIEEFQKPL
jgi:protein-tyrosine phosphatase